MAKPKTREQVLEDALRDLIRNFRQTVASGRSRIVEEAGGDETACDSVEQMLAGNPYLRNAEKALADAHKPGCTCEAYACRFAREDARDVTATTLTQQQIERFARLGCGGDGTRWSFSDAGLRRTIEAALRAHGVKESGTVTAEQARYALDNMDDYARMGGIVPSGAFEVLRKFIEQHTPAGVAPTRGGQA